ncbi:asparaginase [Amaricoccus macauensis]|uniref:asparaginase n=1 Tax=Amaricoccus macauensis TaxID=57001 RepID=UPI003C7A73DA
MAVLLIHTGGTISMARTETGFAPKAGVVEDFVEKELGGRTGAHEIDIELLTPLIDSANATPEDWNRISRRIADAVGRYRGVVVTHGTDTLAYTAAALCFALEGLEMPVILTGSMLPLTEPENDGAGNLRDAFAAVLDAPAGVWVQFAGRRLHGARVYKTHSRKHDAFSCVPAHVPPRRDGAALIRHEARNARVAIIAAAPFMPADLLGHVVTNCDAIILRCFGSGTIPESEALRSALAAARAGEVPVMAVSQCAEGGVALGTYAAGAVLVEGGVADGRDMTVEAAYAKMIHALVEETDYSRRIAFLERPLCGEI